MRFRYSISPGKVRFNVTPAGFLLFWYQHEESSALPRAGKRSRGGPCVWEPQKSPRGSRAHVVLAAESLVTP